MFVFFYTTQETTGQTNPFETMFVIPGYTLYIKGTGPWYSFVGRLAQYGLDNGLRTLNYSAGGMILNFTYYFTKN